MKKFGVGIIVGVVATVATGVGAFLGFKQKLLSQSKMKRLNLMPHGFNLHVKPIKPITHAIN